MKLIRNLKTLWDDEIRIIDNQEKLEEYQKEIRDRGKNFWNDDNRTTVSFDDWDNLEPYKWDIEYLKVVKRGNHEIIYRIPHEYNNR